MLPAFNIKYSRNGGIRFLRIGRIQLSLCICKAKPAPVVGDHSAALLADRIAGMVADRSARRATYAN